LVVPLVNFSVSCF